MSRLLNIQTDLKSLKFGDDRPSGGSSNQPYIKTPIPTGEELPPPSKDFLLRSNAPLNAAEDVSRLFKMFTDLKSPVGGLFTAKQEILSLSAVKTQASNGVFNEGVYTPLSTIAQAGVGFLGAHLYKQGSTPTEGVRTYTDVFEVVKGGDNGFTNRLVELSNIKIKNFPPTTALNLSISSNPLNLLSYKGGPGAKLGIGKTTIPISGQRTGVNNPRVSLYSTIIDNKPTSINIKITGENTNGGKINLKSHSIDNFIAPLIPSAETLTDKDSSIIMSVSPSYLAQDSKTIEGTNGSRINMTSPGQRGNIISYTKGKRDSEGKEIGAIDKINAQPIYQSSTVGTEKNGFAVNDLVNFRIAAINKKDPVKKQFIHFRAFIDSFSDTYNANWDAIRYMGRGEPFYKYNSFGRNINLSFTVAAQSKPELMEQYKKLNFLASNLAPTYSSQGFMGGPLVELTLGGWCFNLPGFISSLTLNVPQESPWEIGINDKGDLDNQVKEMPHIVQVTGMQFTPIHNFRPEKQENNYGGKPEGEGLIDKYGPQRYIALENEEGNNY